MAEKRKAEESRPVADYRPGKKKQKQKGGFQVGPANLPDGTYKRKTQDIKKSLIERAQIKKDYAKLKKQGQITDKDQSLPVPASLASDQEKQAQESKSPEADEEPEAGPHPDRQQLIDKAASPQGADQVPGGEEEKEPRQRDRSSRKVRRPKHQPFQREHEAALKRKAEAEERRKAREEAQRQRQQKIEERERFRKAMAKARQGGPNGQRKLGRESNVLLERVKKMVGEDGK
ncbi:hypothetical protein KC318_g1990 [Hortaea werneckii]|uniref:rRNA-processing protein FYV7 n=1 Tax=Hortaea werneckii TaxID=91943 RepID=A0A3M7A937_HORWE|nr:hypothetical protein KC334_g2078 [Hortaea werneckii]KAI7023574.1 hypothetical protein KC355_g1673 [Hortaea werneckii]KAI7673825.1 hypothetical protein KC318_g1990 [Hortaea werneckii]RMY23879.1 hypothetical protein D0867_01755 [Hortaea werneckii]RMY39901.1 hypothetical protein D0866_01623 [Hortaea werneckii]